MVRAFDLRFILLSAKAVFANAAERAYPIFRYIFPGCARSYSVIRIAYFWVINITAYITYIFIHFISSLFVKSFLFGT